MDQTIGEVIRQARHEQQLTLEEVAGPVGITPGALSHIESGRRLPNAGNATRIAQRSRHPARDHASAARPRTRSASPPLCRHGRGSDAPMLRWSPLGSQSDHDGVQRLPRLHRAADRGARSRRRSPPRSLHLEAPRSLDTRGGLLARSTLCRPTPSDRCAARHDGRRTPPSGCSLSNTLPTRRRRHCEPCAACSPTMTPWFAERPAACSRSSTCESRRSSESQGPPG